MFNSDDLQTAAEIGAEIAEEEKLEPIDERIERARTIALGYQANEVLDVLRNLRDRCPNEWDAIMKSTHGIQISSLWDRLRNQEREIVWGRKTTSRED